MQTQSRQRGEKLNALQHLLPEGMVVETAWLVGRGYSRALLNKYVTGGWLEQPSRGLYRRPGAKSTWQHVVVSLQMLMRRPVSVGGLTALAEQGFGHYVRLGPQARITLYEERKTPVWVNKVDPLLQFQTRNAHRLFANDDIVRAIIAVAASPAETSWQSSDVNDIPIGLKVQRWGDREWSLVMSSPERAIMEFLDELPSKQSFDHADDLFSGLATLSPKRVQELLESCGSVKVKRLFLWFADRHAHPWFKHLDVSTINVGSGKRVIAKGGRVDPKYLITVPERMNGDQ